MMQGRKLLPFALCALMMPPFVVAEGAQAAAHKADTAAHTKRAVALHQFSGVVTVLDKGSMTVEKAGKKARTMTFVRDAGTKTTGELAKDAHVTVWYRDEEGRVVAHKVVVKAAAEN